MTDAQGTITYVNPEFVRVYGYVPSEVVGLTTPRILKGGEVSADEYAMFWEELHHRQVVRREFVNRTKSGATVHIESSANPIVADDQLVGFLAVQRDISDRKATERALRESERRYRALADAAHDSIFIVTPDGRIAYANAASVARFSLRPDQVVGRRLHDVFAPAVADEMWCEVSTVFASGDRHYVEARFDTPAGELWLGTWLVPMSDDAATPDAVLGVARDLTDRKLLEREYAQAQKMEAIGRLAGGIAHDFNNLLTAILGYSELLLERVRQDPALVADVEEVRAAGERASRLTRQLLAFSRKQNLAPQLLSLDTVVKDLHKMLGRVLGEDIHIAIESVPALQQVTADPSQVEQIILNLAVNARDAMPRGGTLRIATANVIIDREYRRRHQDVLEGAYVSLVVQDSGVGMTPEVLARAFEPFFTTKPAGKGTGLGLATVYGIVKQSRGYITIDSELGRGTMVTIYLPAVEAPEGPAKSAPRAVAESGTETILLVEDEPGLRRLMQRTLERLGYSVLMTNDVWHALDVAERYAGPIHLLLSDVVMPGLSGPDLAQRLVRVRPEVAVLYVSGFPHHAAGGSGSVGSRTCFLAKPFTPQLLAAKVRQCLDRHWPARVP
jgi:PAS domain S-box-containing protein